MQTDHWLISQRFTITFNIIFHSMTANSIYGSSLEFGVGRICLPDKHLLIFLNSAKTSPIVLFSCCTLLPGPPLCPSHHTTWDSSLCVLETLSSEHCDISPIYHSVSAQPTLRLLKHNSVMPDWPVVAAQPTLAKHCTTPRADTHIKRLLNMGINSKILSENFNQEKPHNCLKIILRC